MSAEKTEALAWGEAAAKEFADHVGKLAALLHAVPVPTLATAMLQDGTGNEVERIIKQRQQWSTTLRDIGTQLATQTNNLYEIIRRTNAMAKELRPFVQASNEFMHHTSKLKELVELCDRLEAHRASGLLDIVTALKDKPPL